MDKTELRTRLNETNRRLAKINSVLAESERTFRELNSRNMQATLIQIEDFFDSNDLYAFNNWFEGVLWDGPNISRHWIELTLKYPYLLMPEPRAMRRFIDMGVKFSYTETTIHVPVEVKSPSDLDPTTRKPKEKEEKIWLVSLKIPRHLVEDPMPDETEEPDTVQNIKASEKAESIDEPTGEEIGMEGDEGLDIEEGGGDDLEL